MLERAGQPLLPLDIFIRRMVRSGMLAAAIVGGWLAIGTFGYVALAHLSLIDSVYNASMIMSGMGPVDTLPNSASKVFASVYAILSGVVFLSMVAVLMTPVVHRFLHHFHAEPGKSS